MPRPEDITEAEIKTFLEGRSLAALMAVEMGTDKDPVAMRAFVASAIEWRAESADFDAANAEVVRTQYHPRMEYR